MRGPKLILCSLLALLLYAVPSTVAAPASSVPASTLTRDDYVVLVLGCVNIPGNLMPCQNDPRVDWRDWLALIRDELGFGELHQAQFDAWSQIHVRFVRAPTANPQPVAEAVNSISAESGSIYLLGYSAGGAAILDYLEILREQPARSIPPIRGAVTLDSPVGDNTDPLTLAIGRYIDFNRIIGPNSDASLTDRFAGLGAWCRTRGIRVVTVSYEDDYFNPKHPVADIPYKLISSNPRYGGPFDLEKNHGYFFRDPNGLHAVWNYLREAVFAG